MEYCKKSLPEQTNSLEINAYYQWIRKLQEKLDVELLGGLFTLQTLSL
jgi:hypothetical protein